MPADHDVVIVGAGFAGIYAMHKFRDELGLDVQGFEAAGGVGGTWWWNRYPGARCDFESVHYSYSWDDELQREWEWTERFSAQPEILSYLEHCAERYDVARSFRFNTRVVSVVWDETESFWRVGTDDLQMCTARFVVTAPGNLSVVKPSDFPGEEDFTGDLYRTSSWPHTPVDFTGKRVAVIGTGSTGIQLIPEIAKQAAQLTVFQRTANFAAPLGNYVVDPEERRHIAENSAQLRAGSRDNFLGAAYEDPQPSALLATPEERRKVYDQYWETGGFRLVVSTYQDLLFDQAANDTIADYIRDRIRERVDDPDVAELLCPDDHPYATKRAPFETNYYETYNLPHVRLVNARATPIEAITPTGLRTSEEEFEFDAIVLATGFDAFTGPLTTMGIVGRDGVKLEDAWADGPHSFLGIGVHGFPNLFTITGPQSATALYNNPLAIEDHVEFATDAIKHVLDAGATTIEPSAAAVAAWGHTAEGILHMTLIPTAKNSWYMGANIPGKPRAAFFFAGGAPLYRAICADVVATGYGGYEIDGVARPLPPMVKLDPAVALVLGLLMLNHAKPLEECTLEETRATVETFVQLQAPPREVASVQDATFGDGRPAKVYTPLGDSDDRQPVLVFLHPGGWVAGSLAVVDEPCRRLADELGAIVVAPSYRLAPEHPFPAAADDAVAALRWCAQTYPGQPLVVCGESAGGNLAAVAAQRARDEGIELAAQVLLYPPIDRDAQTASKVEYAAGPLLSVAAADGMWAAYLGDQPAAAASPAHAESLAGLAPALVLTCECDPTRDEAEDYGAALAAAGVYTEVVRVPGMIHAAINLSGLVPRVSEFYEEIAAFLAPVVDRTATPV